MIVFDLSESISDTKGFQDPRVWKTVPILVHNLQRTHPIVLLGTRTQDGHATDRKHGLFRPVKYVDRARFLCSPVLDGDPREMIGRIRIGTFRQKAKRISRGTIQQFGGNSGHTDGGFEEGKGVNGMMQGMAN